MEILYYLIISFSPFFHEFIIIKGLFDCFYTIIP